MSRLRIALLNASYEKTDTRRNFRREIDADLVEYDVTDRELPETFGFDALVVTGSAASVYWDDPWIDDLKSWVGEALDRGLPALGVCYGHQLLADVLGGDVESMDDYELGYRTVEHDGESRLFAGIDEEFTVFTTHGDHVSTLPPDTNLLAKNDYGVQAFRSEGVFAVQFHPEYDTATAETVTQSKTHLDQHRRQQVLDDITEENYVEACEAKTLFDNFTQFVREQRSGATAAAADAESSSDD